MQWSVGDQPELWTFKVMAGWTFSTNKYLTEVKVAHGVGVDIFCYDVAFVWEKKSFEIRETFPDEKVFGHSWYNLSFIDIYTLSVSL